jgi:competence protein ComFC
MCESLSLKHICPSCQELFLKPSIYERKLSNGVTVISFYKYQEIKELLFTKHTDLGFYIYNILGELSLKKFADEFTFDEKVVSVPIDDNIKSGYSHTAILNKKLNSTHITPLYNKLRAKNSISYSGKSKAFRLLNPRNFELKNFQEQNVILVDDIITTGTTLLQALTLLKQHKKEPLFCLTLADASNK